MGKMVTRKSRKTCFDLIFPLISSKILEAMIEFKALYMSLDNLYLNFLNAVSEFCNK